MKTAVAAVSEHRAAYIFTVYQNMPLFYKKKNTNCTENLCFSFILQNKIHITSFKPFVDNINNLVNFEKNCKKLLKNEEKHIYSLPLSNGHDIIIIVFKVKFFFDHSDTYNAPIDVFDFSVIKTSLLASTHILPATYTNVCCSARFQKNSYCAKQKQVLGEEKRMIFLKFI